QIFITGLSLANNVDSLEEFYVDSKAAIEVSGRVTAASDGLGIPGVSILVKGTFTGTVSDVEGNFEFTVPNKNDILVFSSIGYMQDKVQSDGRIMFDVIMSKDMQNMFELVVIGYG